ncbi:glycosyltransferase family 4 protein [Candidatus Roizmanbacteria bacterium]|nr:glycosyltransferase family 4 protein [Candidatus Roizmanbacteria bacterium]
MKIGIFDPYLDDLGGGEKYMLTIAQCLSQSHKVDIFWNNKKDINEALKRFPLDLSRVEVKKNIFAKDVSFLKRILISKSYDIIIVLSDGSIPFLLSKNLFIHIQSPIHDLSINFKTRIKLLRIKKIFCNSYFTKFYVDRTYGVNSDVLYPPISLPRTRTVRGLQNKKIEKENIILHVGRFRVKNVKAGDYKKQSVMIDAFRKMVKNGLSNWKLIIAAGVKDEDKDEFNKMVSTAKGFPVDFVINKSNEELLDLYHKAKIYWHASGYGEDLNKHPDYAEHFGISTVEAMAARGVPVVFNAGGQKEIIEDGESGFLWNTVQEFMSFTIKLVSNAKLLNKMSDEALERSKEFTGDRFCKELSDILFVKVQP